MTLSNPEFAATKDLIAPEVLQCMQAKSIAKQLAAKLGAERFDLWFGQDNCLIVGDGVVTIQGPNDFAVKRLHSNFGELIRTTVTRICGPHFDLKYESVEAENESNPEAPLDSKAVAPVDSNPPSKTTREDSNTAPQMTPFAKKRSPGLEAFHFGETNSLTKAGVDHILRQPGHFSPFYVFGPSGCGKSRLLECLTNEVRRRHRCRAVYLTAEQFTSYFVQSIRGSGLPMFRRKYRDLDLLAIDDIQFFEGKKATLSEVQYTIENLIRAGKQVVVAADRPPMEMDQVNADLAARLTSGLTCPLNYPGEEQRLLIAKQFCKDRQIKIPISILELVCSRIKKDVRKLSGAINLLHAAEVASGSRINEEMAENALSDLYTITGSNTSMSEIEKVVCDFCGVKSVDLKSASRKKKVCAARMLAMYLAREHTSSAFSEIGDYFGGRSHSTVIAAQHKVNGWLSTNQSIDLPRAKYPATEVLRRIETKLRIG